jgi:hypothetical protein
MLTISSIGNEETDDRKNANSVELSGRRPARQRLGIPVAWISHLSQTALDLDQSTSAGVTGARVLAISLAHSRPSMLHNVVLTIIATRVNGQ